MNKNTIPIPEDLGYVVNDIMTHGKHLVIQLGDEYNNGKILVTIFPNFLNLKKAVIRELKDKGVEEQHRSKITSLIQDNYQVIYPDDGDVDAASTQETREEQGFVKPDITIEEWKSTLNERYNDLKNTCEKNFPGIWHSIEFELSVLRILNLKGCSLPFAGIILGMPISLKTLGIELFRDCKSVYYTDSFSSKAFVSHNTSVPKDKLAKIDMLPRIKDKCLLAPELSSIFSKKDDDLIEILGILTRVLDGHGYESDSGAHGRRGYSGAHMFTMVGAGVDVPYKVHKHLANLGPKLYFLRMPKSNKTDDDYANMLEKDDFNTRSEELKEKLNGYLEWFDKCCPFEPDVNSQLIKIFVDVKMGNARDVLGIIVKLGKLLARLRGNVTTFHTEKTQGSNYGYSTPTVEEPDRAMTQLLNLAKAHALTQGRTFLTYGDIPLLIKVVMSTASRERVMIFDLLLDSKGTMTTSQVSKSLDISPNTALRTMAELKALQLVSGDPIGMEDYSDEACIRNNNRSLA